MDAANQEQALIMAAQAGDEAAFERLVLRIRDRVYWIARQVVSNAEDAKDVSQNVLIRLWTVLPRYDSRYAFSTWLYRMTVNMGIDHLRRSAPRRREDELDESLTEVVRGQPAAPDVSAREREVGRILEELRELLPPQQRVAFALREMEGLSSEEVAKVLGVRASTVRNHLFQARRTLKRELLERYPEYAPRGRERDDSSGGGGRS